MPRIKPNVATKSSMRWRKPLFLLAGFLFFSAAHASAQDSSSGSTEKPAASIVAPSGPTAALRDLLLASCSQSQQEFVRFLTARNKESFARLTPVTRVAFMKRFVLLNEPGKATVTTNPVGRPTVRCETPDVTTEMQIGGAEIRENLAFLPIELRDATDSTGITVHRVTLGFVREGGEWKLLSLGVLLLDLPSLEAEWDQAEISPNETSALDALKKIAEAIETYRKLYTRLPESLSSLGPARTGQISGQAADLLEPDLALGMKNGYAFRYVILGGSSLGAQARFELSATPLTYQRTGVRSFFRDASGALHAADHQGAVGSETDPRVN
jgi:hypothetical protein